MKRIVALAFLTTLLGGCVIVPVGHGYRDHYDGYSSDHRDYYGDRYRRDGGYYSGYGQRYGDRGR